MNNIIRIQAMLRDRKEEALLLTSPVGRLFATGFASSAGAAVVTRSDAWFFTDFRYFEAASAAVRGVHLEMSRPDLGLPALVRGVLEREKISRLGFEEGQMTVAEYALWSEALPAALVPMQGALDGLRSAKQPYEVEIIRRAQAVTEAAFSAMLLALKPGMTERALILPPESRVGAVTDAEREAVLRTSRLAGRYDAPLDRESAYERLEAHFRQKEAAVRQAQAAKAAEKQARETEKQEREAERRARREARENPDLGDVVSDLSLRMARTVSTTIGREIGRKILRGLMGGILGSRR